MADHHIELRVVKANVEIGALKQLQPRHFIFMLHKKPCPEHASECGACDGSGFLPADPNVVLHIEHAHYQIWVDSAGRWRWSMTKSQYPFDEVGLGSHGGGGSLNACIHRCVHHYEHDILALGRER